MKLLKYIFSITIFAVMAMGCKKIANDDISFLETDANPANLSAFFEITQDNTGLVTITPNGEGISFYEIYYGDATTTPVMVQPGKNTQHVYAEGVYNVKIVGHSITGKITEATKQLTVSFRAPENLDFTITVDPNNNYRVTVTATALYETFFRVYFGAVANEVPVSFTEGTTAGYIYPSVGTYNIRVVALSGGVATTQLIKSVTIVDPVLLPINFESPTVNYAFTDFGGGAVTKIANPQANGINTSANVGRMIKNAPEVWAGSFITLGTPIDFSANKVFRMKVFAPRIGAKVLLKVENLTNGGISFEKEVATTVANAWEDLAFDFRTINTANAYQKIVLIFDLGTAGNGSANFTYLFDDIRLTNTLPGAQIDLPVTFDVAGVNYNVTDFGNAQSFDAVDPVLATNNVKRTVKPNGAETWAGTTMGVGGTGFATRIPMASGATNMSVRVYSPSAGIKVRLKIEDRTDPTKSVETEATTGAANTWETLVFNFNNQAAGTSPINFSYTYNMASIFFDFGVVGNGKVFYWDDVRFIGANPNALVLPLDFQSATIPYTFTNFDGGNTTVIDNPQVSGINTSTKVARMVKNAGQVWGGSWIALGNPINFTGTTKTFRMKVFSPRVGAKVLLKIENLTDGSIAFEREVTTTVANAWENLTFDFSAVNTANSYQKVVLIFDLGTMGDGSANFTFLFDDITLN
jgi:hypothetical protein